MSHAAETKAATELTEAIGATKELAVYHQRMGTAQQAVAAADAHFKKGILSEQELSKLKLEPSSLTLSLNAAECRAEHRAVERGLTRRGPVKPIDLSIDETSEKKGHNYLTVVSEGNCVLHVETVRDKESIDAFWNTLSEEARSGGRSVSMDLWKAYRPSTI